eukprot:scaffold10784_cov111-Amphora_coffeaeformis.AAC.1
MMRINLLAPREPTLEPTHLLARVPIPATKHVWNELGWTPVVWYVVKAMQATNKKFDLFHQSAVPYSKYLNGAMALVPKEKLEEEGYPIVGANTDDTHLYRWSDRVVMLFLDEDARRPEGEAPVIPDKMGPECKPFLDDLVEQYSEERA